MAEERVQRRLAAILAADVVGYSRLMEADEEGTLARMKTLRKDVIDPKIAEYSGRIFKTTGDGILAEFPSAVDAVRHAVDVQRAMARLIADVPEDRRIVIRIGISLGDVMVDGDDLFGNGVNVAARMEGLAKPGGICVSGNVQEHIGNTLDVSLEDMGEQTVKNIERPVRCYRVHLEPDGNTEVPSLPLPNKPSIAVLPFENMSGDPEQEYFADGLSEDIITALCAWRAFPVIARNSSFTYKGKSIDIKEVGEKLGARYVVEGSVRKSGERLRITAQLIDAKTGHHVWAERYDRELADIFELQDEITQRIAAIVAPELEKAEHRRSVTKTPENLDAWECCQRGTNFLREFTESATRQAREMFTRAIALDPNYSQAYTGLAYSHHRDIYLGLTRDRAESIRKLGEAAERAVALDDADSRAHCALGMASIYSGRLKQALSEQERAVALNPSDNLALMGIGRVLLLCGRANDAIPHFKNALRLNPLEPRMQVFYGLCARAYLDARNYDEAVAWAGKGIQGAAPFVEVQLILAAALGHLDRPAEAREALAAAGIDPDGSVASITFAPFWQQYADPDANQHLIDGLRKAGMAS